MRSMWKMIAWLGRYGHQPATVCLGLTFHELSALADGVGELMRDEKDSLRGPDDA